MSDVAPGASYLNKHRLEALTDGIFAVAMTLLVIELKIPESAHITRHAELGAALLHLIPKFIAWVISFFVLAIFWTSHHRLFHDVRVVDTRLTWLTLAYLACVSLMPFSSALTGEYGGLLSQMFYSANMALLGTMALLKSRYVHRHPALCSSPLSANMYKASRLRTMGLIIIAALAVVIAWALPGMGAIGNTAFMLMIVFGMIGRRIEARDTPKQTEAQFLNT
ncbi:MAG: TMEM175 family protein [Usitatibacteraceae bacterium]